MPARPSNCPIFQVIHGKAMNVSRAFFCLNTNVLSSLDREYVNLCSRALMAFFHELRSFNMSLKSATFAATVIKDGSIQLRSIGKVREPGQGQVWVVIEG